MYKSMQLLPETKQEKEERILIFKSLHWKVKKEREKNVLKKVHSRLYEFW